MTPSHFSHQLALVRDRMAAAMTAAASLVVFAVAMVACRVELAVVQPRLAIVTAALALFGAAIAVAVRRLLGNCRNRVYDDILLCGFRHVEGEAVARRADWLVSARRRAQMARSFERLIQDARTRRITPVPLQRDAIHALTPELTSLVRLLRSQAEAVRPAGMVLVHRLLGDGADSPIYRPDATVRELAAALSRILRELHVAPVTDLASWRPIEAHSLAA
ncbi:MAG TPA: hypothetical protein VFW18_02555 [Gaiellales bacterium]|nr:hypothetical protein [Gaiellales bacterium]